MRNHGLTCGNLVFPSIVVIVVFLQVYLIAGNLRAPARAALDTQVSRGWGHPGPPPAASITVKIGRMGNGIESKG
jgi:hypothetical protein